MEGVASLASHRKPRATAARLAALRAAPAVGITTAALTSVALLTQSAVAAPAKPSVEEVQKKVDDLYHQAGVATQKYNAAKERTDKQRDHVDDLLDDVAERTEKLNAARRELGTFAAAQYRTGTMSDTAAMLLAGDPQEYFDQNQLLGRLTSRQKKAVDEYQTQQLATAKKRAEAARGLESLNSSQARLRKSKRDVQEKLGSARALLSRLTAEEKARLAAIEKKKKEEAQRKAAELARQQAAEKARETPSDPGTPAAGSGSSSGYAAKAAKALAFARAQLGKPYVWGATGPDSYDCSGLTQAAWKAAGISLPRTTWDQVKAGTTVSVDQAEPGDLVFFYDDISHVGMYIGDGQMIHAPKPGTSVRTESIYYMPIHSVVRPA